MLRAPLMATEEPTVLFRKMPLVDQSMAQKRIYRLPLFFIRIIV